MVCNTCFVDKAKVNTGEKNTQGRWIYRGDSGKSRWNGNRCPDCVSCGVSRPIVKAEKLRLCRLCDAPLSAARYYNCEDCVNVLPCDDGDMVYFGTSSHNIVGEVHSAEAWESTTSVDKNDFKYEVKKRFIS